MDEGRPIPLLAAVVLLGLIGVGGLLAAPVVAAGATVAEQLDDHLGAIGGAILLAGAVAAVVVGVLGVMGAVGLWRRQAWGWLAAVAATGLVIAGTLLAIASGAQETALTLGLALGIAGALATWLPATRAACDR
jgi:uncharacterized membrane protein (DUF2068 family)